MSGLLLHLSAGATAALVSAIWQGTLLAALVLLAIRLFPGLSAAARSLIWMNVFVLVAALHLVPLALHASLARSGHALHPAFHLDPRWSLAVAGVWLALSLWRAALLIAGGAHLRGLARRAVPVAVEGVADLLATPHGTRVQLCASDQVARPSVLGFFRPRILMPPALLASLSTAELRQVVLHEMEHLRRHDDWTNLVQKLGLVLFPLNPALVWVERQLCAERELACDDRVLHSGGGRKAYALCLTHLAEHAMLRRGCALVLGAWERRPELVRRVHRILSQPARRMGKMPALAVSGGLVVGTLACALTLAHAPQVVSFAPPVFAPPAEQAQTLAPIDPQALGLGGRAQLVRATMPSPQPRADRALPRTRAVSTRAVQVRRVLHPPMPETRLAELRTPPPPQGGTLLVMTQWSDANTSQVTLALAQVDAGPAPGQVAGVNPGTAASAPARHPQQLRNTFAVQATYAVITPNGWLIFQI